MNELEEINEEEKMEVTTADTDASKSKQEDMQRNNRMSLNVSCLRSNCQRI